MLIQSDDEADGVT